MQEGGKEGIDIGIGGHFGEKEGAMGIAGIGSGAEWGRLGNPPPPTTT
jgi:hypothetical protein